MTDGPRRLPLIDRPTALAVLIGNLGERVAHATDAGRYGEIAGLTTELRSLADRLSLALVTEADRAAARDALIKVIAMIGQAEQQTTATLQDRRRKDRNRPAYRKASAVGAHR